MSNGKKGLKNLLYATLQQVVTIAFGLLLPRLWMVSYGSEVNGLINSLNQFLMYLNLFEAGIGAATMQALYRPVAQTDWKGINGILSASHAYYRRTGRWYLAGLMALCVFYPMAVDSSLSYLTIFGAVFFSGIGNVILFYCQGKYVQLLTVDGKAYIVNNLTTLVTVLTSLAKVLLILRGANIVLILAVTFLIRCLQAACIVWYIRRSYPQLRLDAEPAYGALEQKNSVLVHQVSDLIFRNIDVLLLTLVCDLKVVSVYSMFRIISTHLETIGSVPLNSISFALGQSYQTDKTRYVTQITLVESYYSAFVYGLFSVELFLFLPFMRLYTAGVNDINYADGWLAVLFVVCTLMDKSRRPMLNTIQYAGHYRNTIHQTVIETGINLAVSLAGVYTLGIYGVLLGTVAALTYRTNATILYANRKLLERSAWKSYTIYLVDIALFLLTQQLLKFLFSGVEINSWLRFVLVGAGATAVSLLVLAGGQTLLFPHCRAFAGEMAKRLTAGKSQ